MRSRLERCCIGSAWISACMLACLLTLAVSPVPARSESRALLGGPSGLVRSNNGDVLEGMMVQLIAQRTGMRTTVYSNEDGRYEFPSLPPGTYTLRIAQ